MERDLRERDSRKRGRRSSDDNEVLFRRCHGLPDIDGDTASQPVGHNDRVDQMTHHPADSSTHSIFEVSLLSRNAISLSNLLYN
jgi:hypothetical protein